MQGPDGLKRRKKTKSVWKMLIMLNGNYQCYLFIVLVASSYFSSPVVHSQDNR